MSKSPTISVIMPVYNADRYVAQAVESILTQTFADFEFLIVDDGSTDRSLKILRHYAAQDDRIHLTSRPNTGYVIALNEMLRLAKGEFIARMDADDVALPDRFQRQVAFLRQHPEVVCVGGSHDIIDAQGRLLTTLKLPESNEEIQRLALAGHGSICHPCAMIRRSTIIAIGGYNEAMMPAEDLDLWLRLGELGQLANLPEPVLRYRLHMKSVSEQNTMHQRQRAREACEQAWQRRGIVGNFEASDRWRPGTDRASRLFFTLRYGWWAFNSRQRSTAILYGLRAITINPFNLEGWKLLICAIVKPFPKREPTNSLE
ncbi:MAG: glycosyltransferase [Cyanobacteria bacterium]|nr:glycosyltransferase [Cyanobacteriota bacterium]MDW8202111.1 glycosyltransferase [Cyanobacteriota bacterium SKYGB_h_bin112]